MSELSLIPAGGGEVVGDAPDRRVEILSDHESVNATWSRFGPGRDGADLHVHHHHTDFFYVLDGEITLRLGLEGETRPIPAGTLARVPPHVVHGFRNGSGADARYLNFHAPGQGFADYMRALRDGRKLVYDQHDPPPDGGRSTTEAVVGGTEPTVQHAGMALTLLTDIEAIAVADAAGGRLTPHVHHRHAESFYVLEGELALTAGGAEHRASAGAWVQVPPGVAHTVSGAARFLAIHTPSCGFGAFLRALGESADEVSAAERAGFDQSPA